MERKIGEIFEYNGEWYQCVESDSCGECSLFTTECGSGTKSDLADKVFGQCSKVRRTDNKHVIFKKLEKVGEPYVGNNGTFQSYKLAMPIYGDIPDQIIGFTTTEVVIKQNKEDMEEKKEITLDEMIKKCEELEFNSYYKQVKDWLIELKQCKEEKHSNSENIGKNLKPFDLEAAKAGKPVCTRDGRKARIICFDRRLFYKNVSYPILAVVERSDEEDDVCGYNEKGTVLIEDGAEYKDDLMMLPEKK